MDHWYYSTGVLKVLEAKCIVALNYSALNMLKCAPVVVMSKVRSTI